jgi:hypothetical protein
MSILQPLRARARYGPALLATPPEPDLVEAREKAKLWETFLRFDVHV